MKYAVLALSFVLLGTHNVGAQDALTNDQVEAPPSFFREVWDFVIETPLPDFLRSSESQNDQKDQKTESSTLSPYSEANYLEYRDSEERPVEECFRAGTMGLLVGEQVISKATDGNGDLIRGEIRNYLNAYQELYTLGTSYNYRTATYSLKCTKKSPVAVYAEEAQGKVESP